MGTTISIWDLARSVWHETTERMAGTLFSGERWSAVHTLPFAEAQLHRQGFRTFQSKRCKTVRHARRLSTAEAPFFPRYLFVALDLGVIGGAASTVPSEWRVW